MSQTRVRDRRPDVVSTHPDWWTDLDTKAVDTARLLAADAVQKVGNGHPGTAMSLAPLAYLLYQRVMRHDPTDPNWIGRDRFILSNGHSSLTQYCQLFLSGYGLELADLEALRTWGSLTPGHPEHGHTARRRGHHRPARPGRRQRRRHGDGRPPRARPVRPRRRAGRVAVRPPHLRDRRRRLHGGGRLERGVLARRPPAARQPDPVLRRQPHLDRGRHRGRVQRGRARALRGLRLARPARRLRRGRHRAREGDRGGPGRVTDKPSIIAVRTIIGWPAPTKQNTGKAHGSALGEDEIRKTKEILGFDPDVHFAVDADVLAHAREVVDARPRARTPQWQTGLRRLGRRQPRAAPRCSTG